MSKCQKVVDSNINAMSEFPQATYRDLEEVSAFKCFVTLPVFPQVVRYLREGSFADVETDVRKYYQVDESGFMSLLEKVKGGALKRIQ